jgi:NIPSNAP
MVLMAMNRRELVKGGMALAAVMAAGSGEAQEKSEAREYYLLRQYKLNRGAQDTATQKYFKDVLLPALGRMGMGPVGVMSLAYGDGTPMLVVLIPGPDALKLSMLDLHLEKDQAFMAAAAPYWAAPANTPIFDRVDSQLSIAFEGFPKIIAPAKEPRVLQIRTYESPTNDAHVRKVEMFHQGEFRIFAEAGAKSVYYSDNLVGARGPSLTYMLCHKDLASLEQNWKNFIAHPDWKKLSATPRYGSDPIVSRVDNLILTPTPYSQI